MSPFMYIQVVGGLHYQKNLTLVFMLLTDMLSVKLHYYLSQLEWQLVVQHWAKVVSGRLHYVDDKDINAQSGAKCLLALHHSV